MQSRGGLIWRKEILKTVHCWFVVVLASSKGLILYIYVFWML